MSGVAEPGDVYEQIARWYDLEHDAILDDIEAYQKLLIFAPAPTIRIIDIGCGTGRITTALAAAGYRVTGLDPSRAMLERAHTRLSQLPDRIASRVELREGLAERLPFRDDETFQCAVFGLNTFAHLTSPEVRGHALANMCRALETGGQILLDLDLLGIRRLLETSRQVWWQGTWPIDAPRSFVTHWLTATPGEKSGVLDLHHFYDLEEDGGVQRTHVTMPVAVLSAGEVLLAMRHAGFEVEGTYGSYALEPYEESSPRLIVDARKQ